MRIIVERNHLRIGSRDEVTVSLELPSLHYATNCTNKNFELKLDVLVMKSV